MNKRLINIASVFFIAVILQACSAGGGETGTGQNDTAVSVGVITGFSSVYVNGIKFETGQNTTVSIDGNANALESSLSVGMLVTISGNVNADGVTGSASSIIFEDNVEGLVVENSLAQGGVLNVMGQEIVIDNDTVFRSSDGAIAAVEALIVGNIVEVSGYSDGAGKIYATRVELKRSSFTSGEDIEVKGVVKAVSGLTFTIGSLSVAYTTDILDGFSESLKSGDFISVKSTIGFNNNNELVASAIELKEKKRTSKIIDTDKDIQFSGVISQFDSIANTFVINSETILLTGSTEYKEGGYADIKNSVKVKVKGTLNTEGIIVADSVKIKQTPSTYYEGSVTEVNPEERYITLLGVRVYWNNSTRLIDDRDIDMMEMPQYNRQYFTMANVEVGDNVQVSAFTDVNGLLVASKLERENKKMDVDVDVGELGQGIERELEGVVSGYLTNSTTIVVSGVEIDIQYAEEIPDDLANGVMVEIKGIETENGWFATEIDVKHSSDS